MTVQDFTDILYFYEEFKPQYIKYVSSIREMTKNVQAIDKFKNIEDKYKDDIFNKIYTNRIADIDKKVQEIVNVYCGLECQAHCKHCCVVRCINECLLKEIEKVDLFKNEYQALLNTINKTIKYICNIHQKADDRTQKHLTVCLDILHLYRYEMLCLLQLIEAYKPQPKNNNILLHQTVPMTPDMVSIPLKDSPEYGSTEEFWKEISAMSQKKLEDEYRQLSINKQTAKVDKVSTIKFTFDFSEQWKKYPEQMKKWAETPKTVPELIRKYALEFQDKRPQLPLDSNTVQYSELKNHKIFISYSHKDEKYKNDLLSHLKGLERTIGVNTWHDGKIIAGKSWSEEIKQELRTADIILLLISADFNASDFIWKEELSVAIEKHKKGEAIVIPIFVKDCDTTGMPYMALQGFPKNAKPISKFNMNRNTAYKEISEEIRNAIIKTTNS